MLGSFSAALSAMYFSLVEGERCEGVLWGGGSEGSVRTLSRKSYENSKGKKYGKNTHALHIAIAAFTALDPNMKPAILGMLNFIGMIGHGDGI